MKRILLVLFSIFILSTSSFAHHLIICDGGVARLVSYYYDENGIPVTTSSQTFAGCDGLWICILDFVTPSGAEPCCELPQGNYNSLNTEDPYVPSDFTTTEAANFQTLVEEEYSSATHGWVNPFKLSSQAYTALYGSQAIEMFYVHTAIRTSDGANILKLYSDASKTMSVTYKTLLGVTVDSENVSVSAGSNSIELTAPTGMSNGTYNVVVTGASSFVNTTIVISH